MECENRAFGCEGGDRGCKGSDGDSRGRDATKGREIPLCQTYFLSGTQALTEIVGPERQCYPTPSFYGHAFMSFWFPFHLISPFFWPTFTPTHVSPTCVVHLSMPGQLHARAGGGGEAGQRGRGGR